MKYLEEQTDGEAMINLIKNGDQPLPHITQVSIAGTSSTEQPSLKDKSICNKTAKDLWDALARYMLGSEYSKQDRKAAVLYEYETFKATEGELLLDTYIRYLQVINDLKKCGYSKDNCELNFKFLNNLQPDWKQYATMMRQNKNLMNINIDALYNILKQNQGDVNDAMGSKKKTVVVTSDPLALIAEKTKKSYADLKRKSMEFQVGDKVMLKVSLCKRVVRFGKRGKLNPRYVGPFKVLERIGDVAYKLDLPEELSRVHNTFHVANLRKCHADEPLAVPLDGLHFDDKLQFMEEPVEIIDHEVK
nr:putative reverse transcriptase domain-containing protein [Tanacetum cinerariifolium]